MIADTKKTPTSSKQAASPRPSRTRAGFTLVEAAISTVIVGIMIVAALETVGSSAQARRRSIAIREADDLLAFVQAEITGVYFDDPLGRGGWGPESGESDSPRNFDDVDDYDGLSESQPTDRSGKAIDAFANWKYTVAVTPVLPTLGGMDRADATSPLRQVEVEVRSQDEVVKQGIFLISRAGTAPFDARRTLPRNHGIALRAATAGGKSVTISTPTLNAPEVP